MRRHKATDADGKALKPGDRVRVLGAPDLSGMRPRARAESAPVFAHLVGTVKRIAGFDELGNAELVFRIRSGKHRGLHAVAIEPFLLRRSA